jgi:hypothetical protein
VLRSGTRPPTEASGELRPLLDEEVARLSDKYRAPLVLCLLEGRSRKEAAGLLGCGEGTLSGRLARVKELLARRLRRRGVALTTAALAAALAGEAAGAPLPAWLTVAPHQTVCVDTKPPEVAMRAERADGKLDLSWEVTDDNLGIETLALRYRPSGGDAWSSLPIPRVAHGRHSFVLPESIPGGVVDLRLEVRDRAGNVGARAMTLR